MNATWQQAFAKTESFEGWHRFSDDPADPGGKTYDGVIQRTYDAYRRIAREPLQDVRKMTDAECASIMKNQYWLTAGCGELFAGLDFLIYDISVNCGPGRAIRMLQQGLGVTVDGVFGLHTLDAAQNVADQQALLHSIAAIRLSFWRRLTTWWRFGRGWSSRGEGSLEFALEIWKAAQPAT